MKLEEKSQINHDLEISFESLTCHFVALSRGGALHKASTLVDLHYPRGQFRVYIVVTLNPFKLAAEIYIHFF